MKVKIKDFGRFNLFWKPVDEEGAKACEGGAMAYELRVTKTKDDKKLPEVLMEFECAPVANLMQVTELSLSLMNL